MRLTALAVLCVAAGPLGAQGIQFVPRIQPEVRGEVVVERHTAALVLLGANTALGYYVRAGLAVGAGAIGSSQGTRLATRADCSVRFLLDPFAEHAWGPYAGGGLTARRDGDEPASAGVLFLLGVEGRRRARWTPAVELALGEGVRLAVVLRKSRTNGR
jgi:hypothetical protein